MSRTGAGSEYAFELDLCAHLEVERDAVLARQLGGGVARPGGRVLDVVLVEPGASFEERAAVTDDAVPVRAVESGVGPGRFRQVTDAIDGSPARARSVAEAAADAGFFELDRRDGALCARQVARYPEDWFGELVGVENKPDLGSPGALADQLRVDVGLGLVDRVVVATETHVTGAHLNRLPDEVGVWRFHREDCGSDREERAAGDTGRDDHAGFRLEVVREPEQLPVDDDGVELLERHAGHADVAFPTAAEKTRARLRLAERAYGSGWRPAALPDCAALEPGAHPTSDCLPYCTWKDRLVHPAAECGAECAGHEPAPAPATDPVGERDARSPWRADPSGLQRRQAGLGRFAGED